MEVTEWARPAPFSCFVNLLKSEAECEQAVLLAHGPCAGKAEALAQPQHGLEALDGAPCCREGAVSCRKVMPASRGMGLAARRRGCRCPLPSRRTARGHAALLGPLLNERLFSSALPLCGVPALAWATSKKDLPMFLSTLLGAISRWLRYRDGAPALPPLGSRAGRPWHPLGRYPCGRLEWSIGAAA